MLRTTAPGGRSAAPLLLVCFLVAAGFAPSGTSQVPEAPEIDLSLEAVSVFVAKAVNQPASGPIIIDEDNTITALVKNHGRTAVDAAVVATASDGTGSWGPVTVSVNVPAGETKSVEFDPFDGTYASGNDFKDTVTIDVDVYVSPEEMVVGLLGFLEISEPDLDPLSEAWSGLWDENIASLQELVEDTVFSDETEPAEEAWNALWGTHLPSLRATIESIVLKENPTRLDNHPSDNHQQLTRGVAYHGISLNPITTIPSGTTLNVENGDEWESLVRVTNDGTRDDVVDIRLEDESADWDFELDQTSLVLPAEGDDTKVVKVTMKGKPTAAADEQGTVKLVITSRNAPLTGKASQTLMSPPAEVDGELAIAISEPLSASIAAGSSTSYEATVKNLENRDLIITLVAPPPTDDGWSGTTSESQTTENPIEPGGTAAFIVDVTVGSEAVHGTYDFNVAITAAPADGSDPSTGSAPTPFTLDVLQWHGVDFQLLRDNDGNSLPTQVEPGSLEAISFEVENKGNGPDSFQISLIDAPSGWQLVDANGEAPAPFDMDPFETQTIEHFLKTPSTTPTGQKSLRLRIASEISGSTTDFITHALTVPARVFPGIAVAATACQGEEFTCALAAGSDMAVPLSITNHGNVAGDIDLTATAPVELRAGPNKDDWSVSVNPASFTLASGQSAQATLTIESPEEITIHDAATIALELLGERQHDGNDAKQELTAIGAFADLAIGETSNDPSPLYRNVPGEFTFEVKNEGAADADAFDAKVVYTAGSASVATETATIPSLPKGDITTVTVDVPTLAGHEDLKATITLDPDDDVVEYDLLANVAEVDLTLRTFDIQITPPDDMEDIEPGQAVSLEGSLGFLVENAGSSVEAFTVTLLADPAWTDGTWSDESLAPEAQKSFGTNFFIPEEPESTTAVITLVVQHDVHEELEIEEQFTIQVLDDDPPEIESFPLAVEEVSRGTSVELTATIWDASGIDAAKAVVLLPTGAEQRVEMVYDEDSEKYVALVPLINPGETQWYIWARDASPDEHESSTASSPYSVRVLSESQPKLSLVSPPSGKTIRPGQEAVIGIADTTGIDSARAQVLGETITLPNTYPILLATDDWPDGAVQVTISIVDVFGTAVEETYAINVDGTPPTIGEAALGAAKSGKSAEIIVPVSDNDAVEEVKLRVDPGGGGAVTDQIMAASGSSYVVEITVPSKGGSLTVIAVDAAGNSASKTILGDGAIAAIGVGNQEAPGLGVMWILLLVAGLAAGRIQERRR